VIRITAGRFRGRRLEVPRGVRPTTEIARKAVFDILGDAIVGARVLDACAGSGAYGLEALSRGAAHATFVERERKPREILEANIASLGVAALARVEGRSVGAYATLAGGGLSPARFDVIFHDPQWDDSPFEDVALLLRLLSPEGVLVHERGDDALPPPGAAPPSDQRRYGTTRLLFFGA
jgi:16S rRNA (guanine966-N2)-methyltransferase